MQTNRWLTERQQLTLSVQLIYNNTNADALLVRSQRRVFSMHYHCIHWHAPLFYKRKAGAWHQQMPACFISVSLRLSWQRGDTICPPGGGGSDKGSQAPPAVRNDFVFGCKDDSLKKLKKLPRMDFILFPPMS